MPLKQWQERLDSHFTAVRKDRPAGRPIFALEHGLSEAEVLQLSQAIKNSIHQKSFSADTPLPWAVYSAEAGYQYAGDEYWETFESNTPGWRDIGERNWIRDCFLKFRDKFDAATPSGVWANHFSIICWPIAHAILPKDLQRQLAFLLYDLRLAFRKEHFESPDQLGELLAANSWNSSSRFQYLLQTPALVGQIATALLLQGREPAKSLLLTSTLKRIASDLDRERRAREWLQSAKSRAQTVHLSGLRRTVQVLRPRTQGQEARKQAATLGIEPEFVLRPMGDSNWNVFLKIPPFAPLRARFSKFDAVLSGSRCVVAGSALRSPLARGRLLYGTQEIPLERWPHSDETLLSFEGAPPELEHLVNTECLLTAGPIWLFRLQADGNAYEIRGKTIRPGQNYLVLCNDSSFQIAELGSPTNLSCKDVTAAQLNIPSFISKELGQLLQKYGLTQYAGIETWPAGIPPALWDEEGRAEWIYPDTPRLAIKLDHTVEKLHISLENVGKDVLEIATSGSAEPHFVELPELEPGAYTVRLRANYGEPRHDSVEAMLDIVVKEPATGHRYGSVLRKPLNVYLDPLQPSVEQLWQGECNLEIAGPRGRNVVCTVDFLGRENDQPLFTRQFSPMSLPVSAEHWRQDFARHVSNDRKIQDIYDHISRFRIKLDGGELGQFSLQAEREFTPLRWIAQREKEKYHLQLLDDSGSNEKLTVSSFSFQEPGRPHPIDGSIATRGFSAIVNGGLYLASIGSHHRSIVIPPALDTIGLSDLRLEPKFDYSDRSPETITQLIKTIEAWAHARIPGHILAITWRSMILKDLCSYLFYRICGKRWKDAERAEEKDGRYVDGLFNSAIRNFPRIGGALEQVRRGGKPWADLLTGEKVIRFAGMVQQYGLLRPIKLKNHSPALAGWNNLQNPRWFAEFVLRLASAPQTVELWSGDLFSPAVETVLFHREVACAARCFVLSSAYPYEVFLGKASMYRGWEWS